MAPHRGPRKLLYEPGEVWIALRSTGFVTFPRLQPELDQASDRFGPAWRIVLLFGPIIDFCEEFIGKADSTHRIISGRGPSDLLFRYYFI